MEDSNRHKGMRKRLALQLYEKGIQDEKVLGAIQAIPRHFFLDKAFEEHAYEDKAFPIDEEQTISQPYTVAYQTELLNVQKREKVLEVGTGSGYQSAILALLGARLYTIERHEKLQKKAKKMFDLLGLLGIRSYFGDGYRGLGEFAPFDKILVTAGATEIPTALKEQLKIGGVLVIPVGNSNHQKMLKITRTTATDYKQEVLKTFRFVPLLKGKNSWKNI
ncbi:protein-L-isoaspartate(D-aspartate) O-methyltransferase [Aureispira anguillae]|uniref:Protein-L-isoaspartate O-methyltransferase n=1 Tax=Aureispira anguillae TaxID=2864201 RepID=A0A916DVA8_9BACT|nr:protein-L-isoaspartate(D-aspartate) O-methyltransferase [Aureispira anguillae]BDS14949.1 protein-L-isoaspartate(D-aspartate) O-methyltransferase [Aureispira anguillae]